jgi:hypothetical protein
MALDGLSPSRDQRMLSNREAALLRGDWWECAADGAQVWQRLTIKPTLSKVERHASEAVAVIRAIRQLKRRRVELMMHFEQLKARLESVGSMPMARLLARKNLADLEQQITAQRKLLDELPQQPAVHRLDPDASCGVLADAMTKEIAQEVTAASPIELPPPTPAISWPPAPITSTQITAAKVPARIDPVATPLAPDEFVPRRTPTIQPAFVQARRDPHPDSLEGLATRPFDESLLDR